MPDWFYRTVAQRTLFCLPDKAARAVALGPIGTLGKSKAGRAVIEFMGHMAPDSRLAVRVGGMDFSSPVGIGWRVDPEQRATRALSCFGAGWIEIFEDAPRTVSRLDGEQLKDGDFISRRLSETHADDPPRLRRSVNATGREIIRFPSGIELPVLAWDDRSFVNGLKCQDGVVLQVGTRLVSGGWRVPAAMPEEMTRVVEIWRQSLLPGAAVIVAGGVGRPEDVVTMIDAGASLILVDAGMIFRGPGLVKRCNDALLRRQSGEAEAAGRSTSLFRRAWFWTSSLGVAMMLGGALTLVLALTRVLLPYDEHYLGLTGSALRRNSPQLFAFMAHDRGTLAGTMLGLGWLYGMLACHGVRRNVHGARTAVIASACAGFTSFFAFFGFGYFDTLHAFVAAVLFQLTVQIMVGEEGGAPAALSLNDEEDGAWRRAQWGQLFWVVHAVGLLLAGGLILGIGMTSVFVSEDLNFLCLNREQAQALGERMMGVVAHDRATLGGMLLASGAAMLLPVLWCFKRGASWLWHAIAGLGIPAYAAALGVHFWVGYTDWRHTVPAMVGLGLWCGGLWLSRAYLVVTEKP